MPENPLTPATFTRYWQGTDTDFTKATNWSASASEVGRAIPTNGDEIVFGSVEDTAAGEGPSEVRAIHIGVTD